jgi:hypothetical protein
MRGSLLPIMIRGHFGSITPRLPTYERNLLMTSISHLIAVSLASKFLCARSSVTPDHTAPATDTTFTYLL